MATVSRPELYPAGTVVRFFRVPVPPQGELLKNNTGNPESWKPALAKVGEATVAADGTLAVTGAGGPVLCWAEVGGKDVFLRAEGTSSGSVPKVKTTSTLLAAANPNRSGLTIQNLGPTNVIYLGLGQAAVLKEGIGPIAVNGSWDGRVGGFVWKGAVFGIAETAEVTASVIEV